MRNRQKAYRICTCGVLNLLGGETQPGSKSAVSVQMLHQGFQLTLQDEQDSTQDQIVQDVVEGILHKQVQEHRNELVLKESCTRAIRSNDHIEQAKGNMDPSRYLPQR